MTKAGQTAAAVRREPVTVANLLLTLVQALLALLGVFDVVTFTAEQTNAMMVFVSVIVSLVNATFVRSRVTPLHDPRDSHGNQLAPAVPESPAITPLQNIAGMTLPQSQN